MKKFTIAIAMLLVAFLVMVGTIPYLSASAASNTITLSAYSYFKDGDGLGHAWIEIENDTNNTYDVGAYSMTPGETITVGLWGNLEDNGVWYNVESYGIDEFDLFDGRVSVEETITEEELDSISSYILNHDYWNVSYNCSCFVKDIWNMVSEDDLNSGFLVNLPSWLCNSIKGKDRYFTNRYIPTNDKIGYVSNNVFHYKIPSDLEGSSGSSANAYNDQLLQTSFPELSLEENVMAQLDYMGSNLTYAEYVQYSGAIV